MIANVSAHRRANAFAQALDERPGQGRAAQQGTAPESRDRTEEASRMLALAGGLGALPPPVLDPEVKVVQRAQLVAAMETMLREGTVPGLDSPRPSVPGQRSRKGAHRANPLSKLKPRTRLSKRLAAGGLTVSVAAGAFGGVAAASGDALPGDSLYGLKRGMEDLRLGMAGDDADRGQLLLDQASTRLSEARRLMDRGSAGRLDHEHLGEVRRALNGVKYDAGEGHRLLSKAYEADHSLGHLQALSSFAGTHREAWDKLRDRLPVQFVDVSDEVTSVFDAMESEVTPLLPHPPAAQPGTPEQPGSPAAGDRGNASPHARERDAHPGDGKDEDPRATPSKGAGHGTSPAPSGKAGEDDGLLGDAGRLLDPLKPSAGASSPGGTGHGASPGDQGGTDGADTPGGAKDHAPDPVPDITLPPLLPGVLPGLGLGVEDDS
ncbi:DUF5667 domain-containing protein [Streptomyces sp. SPB074]|uniref:DUF5667 domain-containing protein n=1 Tax=Streptomyces sp. (strain SPB074) TaxID=465543 RepID=UPI00017F12D3|nr:DUF5667 domain-containing protein [Streptomyces sp. SPB074]EDY46780.1 conserved hypothetical protein [Streptomyces sp. SPB074]